MIKLLNILRSKVVRGITCSLILIHLFNYSIDYQSLSGQPNSSHDEIESIAELMCEEVLNMDDIFSDVEETGSDKSNRELDNTHLFFISGNFSIANYRFVVRTKEGINTFKSLFIASFIAEITTPPPEDFQVKS